MVQAKEMPGRVAIRAMARELGEEVRNLVKAIDELSTALHFDSGKGDGAGIQRATNVLESNQVECQDRLTEMRALVDAADPKVRDDLGDALTRYENLWQRAAYEWGKTRKALDKNPRGDPSEALKVQREQLALLDLEISYCTIPSRLTENLASVRVGAALDFKKEFKDEFLPDSDHDQKVFEWIYDHPAAVPAVIDKARALVFKASAYKTVRVLSVLLVVGVAVGVVFLPGLRTELELKDKIAPTVAKDSALCRAVVWALVGAMLHWFIDVSKDVKRAKENSTEAPTVGGWLLWAHVRYLQLIFSVVTVMIAAIVSAHLTKGTDVVTMLASGYSADSIVDLLQPKATSLMAKRTEKVKKALE